VSLAALCHGIPRALGQMRMFELLDPSSGSRERPFSETGSYYLPAIQSARDSDQRPCAGRPAPGLLLGSSLETRPAFPPGGDRRRLCRNSLILKCHGASTEKGFELLRNRTPCRFESRLSQGGHVLLTTRVDGLRDDRD
jgi:hypothetical protein